MRFFIAIGLMAVSLTGCGAVYIGKLRNQYDHSREAYKACLALNPASACENQRLAMNADARAWASAAGSNINLDVSAH